MTDDRPIEDMTDEEVKAYLTARGYTEEKMAAANLKVLRAVNARLRTDRAALLAACEEMLTFIRDGTCKDSNPYGVMVRARTAIDGAKGES